jgi:CheY-like chemotaxis protein
VVDDDIDLLDVERQLLSDSGATVTTAHSAEQALGLLRSRAFDVLLSDLGMPGTDGFALIESVRSTLGLSAAQLPAAAITAFARPEDKQRALRMGYQACILKPTSPTELTRIVRDLLPTSEPMPARMQHRQAPRRCLRTLFVEDHDHIREQLAWMLRQEGLDLVVCATGEEAEAEFKRDTFDIVVTDISLPKMSGVDLARRVLADAPETWIVFATGYPMSDALEQFGPNVRSLTKPFEVEDLRHVLNEIYDSFARS